jgi:hypothetical protein
VAEAFTNLGFPDYFRVELAWAKLLGVVLLLAPVPARLKEWAYAGFAITIGSALIAHFAVGDGPEAWALRRAPACSGGSRTSSGAAWRPASTQLRRSEVGPCGRAAESRREARAHARQSAGCSMVSWAPQHPRVLERLSEGQSMAVKPVAEVTVLPKPGDSAAKGNSMTTARVEADARALVWPQICCCCGSNTDLASIGIYSMTKFGNTRALIYILTAAGASRTTGGRARER